MSKMREEFEESDSLYDGIWSPDHQLAAMLAVAPKQQGGKACGTR